MPVCWLSVDPVRRRVDFYPRSIAARIEKAYSERDIYNTSPTTCVLGSDFFNATVHFHPSGACYQTTPGASMGRAGFKQPGYRSVKRVVKEAGVDAVRVHGKQIHGEWRLSNEADAEITFNESIPAESVVDGGADLSGAAVAFRPWSGSDLEAGAWDAEAVVWQWCRGLPERHGNLLALGDEMWCPYVEAANHQIERAFAARLASVDDVDVGGRLYSIKFTPESSFALQRRRSDDGAVKERAVRRVVKSVQEIKSIFDRMKQSTQDPFLEHSVPHGEMPHHFLCPIFQDVMIDPVNTVDGHTYDRAAIERWFSTGNTTSPLTGVVLTTTSLTPNASLREQIRGFLREHESRSAA